MQPILIGYFPKRVTARPDLLDAPRVKEICSVSECIAHGPDDWISKWTHNKLWVYDTVSAARAVIASAEGRHFRVFAYRLLPSLFDKGREMPFALPQVEPEPLPDCYQSLGFDVVNRIVGTNFECSPLSCNYLAREIETNEFCLLPTLERAIEIALQLSNGGAEPGPYVVMEVLREIT